MVDSIGQRFIDAWNTYDPSAVADLFTEDGTHEVVGSGKVHQGRSELEASVAAAGKDWRLFLLGEHSTADRYTIEWETEGTHTSRVGGSTPTNKPFQLRGASIGNLDGDGKITENRDYYNLADLLQQVGLLSLP